MLTGTAVILSFIMLHLTVFRPVLRAQRERSGRAFDLRYRALQIWAIKRYYPVAEDLSYEEIAERFDVSTSYNNIGQAFLRANVDARALEILQSRGR